MLSSQLRAHRAGGHRGVASLEQRFSNPVESLLLQVCPFHWPFHCPFYCLPLSSTAPFHCPLSLSPSTAPFHCPFPLPPSTVQVAERLVECCGSLPPISVAQTFGAYARAGVRHDRLLQLLCVRGLAVQQRFSDVSAAQICWAIANLG